MHDKQRYRSMKAILPSLRDLLRRFWRPFRNQIIPHLQSVVRVELSVQRREFHQARLQSTWSARRSLQDGLLFVFKYKDLSDHLVYAMSAYLAQTYTPVHYLGFSRYEKPRHKPARGSAKLLHGVAHSRATHVFAYDGPLSIQEARYLQAQGIRLASSTVGLASFSCGGAADQAEAFDILRSYSWYFVNHAPHVYRLRQEGVNAFPLPMAYNPRWFKPLQRIEPYYDVLFVGDLDSPLNSSRPELLKHVARHFRVALLSYKPTTIENVEHVGSEVNPYRLNRLFHRARIILGSDRVGDISALNNVPGQYVYYDDAFYLRQRAYLVLGAGRCYMVERHPEIARRFEDEREIVLWDDYDELCHHIDFYLRHEDERQAIGIAGHHRAVSGYTVSHMWQSILEIMGLLSPDFTDNV